MTRKDGRLGIGTVPLTVPPRDKDDHVNAKSVQPPTRAVSRFPLDESCAGDPRRARQVCPDGVKVSGKLTAGCRQGLGGPVADVMRALGRP